MPKTKQTTPRRHIVGAKAPPRALATKAAYRARMEQAKAAGKTVPKPLPVQKHDHPKPRYRPGEFARREIRMYQQSTEPLIKHMPFYRLVKETLDKVAPNGTALYIESKAVPMLREAVEAHCVTLLEDAGTVARHAKRVTIYPKDMQLAQRMRSIQ